MALLKIHELPKDERPREKLIAHGVGSLSDAELIGILLRTGRRGANVVDVAREFIQQHGSLRELSRCSVPELCRIVGIKEAKAVHLKAAFGLGDRLAREVIANEKFDCPERVYELLASEMRQLRKESLRVVLLDTRYRLLRDKKSGTRPVQEVSHGSVNESIAHPRDIFHPAVAAQAYAVIVVHNHPSGDPSPSQTDHSLTRRLAEAAELLQIKLLDHIIIGEPMDGRPGYFSFKEAGVL